MTINKSILVMCLADPASNPRPNRIIQYCVESGYVVDVLSYPCSGEIVVRNVFEINKGSKFIDEVKKILSRHFINIISNKKIKNIINNYSIGVDRLISRLIDIDYDLIIVEDLKLLPLAHMIKNKARIIFDAREYYPLQKENSLYFRLFEQKERRRICEEYLHKCDKVITVSYGLKEKYYEEYSIKCDVIKSTPYYVDMDIKPVDNKSIRLVYHGGANSNRNLENMIKIVENLSAEYSLDMYLVGSKKNISKLKSLISHPSKVQIKEPIPYKDIISTLNSYDIGFYYLEPTGFNVKYALPNKLFEYIQARLMIVIGPSPDMRKIVEEYRCGIVSSEFSIKSMVKTINGISKKDISKYKKMSAIAAETLNYEVESKKYNRIISNL